MQLLRKFGLFSLLAGALLLTACSQTTISKINADPGRYKNKEVGVVGRVVEVQAYTSVVDLISSPGVRLAGTIEGENRPISFQGGVNPTFGPAKGIVEFVPLDIFVTPTTPKRLVTSGLGGVFPQGLSLGEIVQLEPSTDGLFQTGEVQLDPRLSALNEVTVLVPLNPE